ncbi:MAG: outer membrane protein transport protein [Rhodanobacteraceae bacterium]
MTPRKIAVPSNPAAPRLVMAALALAVSGILAMPSTAEASGFQLKENSAKGLGRSFAGSTAAPGDVSSVINNPAAMSTLDGVYFKADLTLINFSTKFSGGGQDVTGAPLTGGNGGDGGLTQPVPAIYFAMPVGEASHIGVAVTVPYGFTTEYNKDWVGRYKAVKSKLQTLDFTVSYSYAFNNHFSLGGSLIAQQTKADLTSMVDFGTFLGTPQQYDGLARITGSATDYGWQLGGLWKLNDRDSIGLNYRAKISHTLKGNATFHDVPSQLGSIVGQGNFVNTSGQAGFDTPYTAVLSYWHQGDRISFGADVSRTGWSSFKELRVKYGSGQPDTVEPENWRDTSYVSVGADYRLSNQWTVRAGLAYDQTPTRDSTRTPRVPDGARRWLSFGLDYTPSTDLEFSLGFAHLWVNDGSIANAGPATGGPTGTTLFGKSKNNANLLGMSGTFRF